MSPNSRVKSGKEGEGRAGTDGGRVSVLKKKVGTGKGRRDLGLLGVKQIQVQVVINLRHGLYLHRPQSSSQKNLVKSSLLGLAWPFLLLLLMLMKWMYQES